MSCINVVLENIRSALNVGAIFRTCDAVGIDTLYLTGITPYPPHNKIPKTALGSIDSVNWVHDRETLRIIKELKQKGNKIVSIEISDNSKSMFDYTFDRSVSVVFGNEISGISPELIELSDDVIHLPMNGIKESLNVATCCGIVLYEILRQTRIK